MHQVDHLPRSPDDSQTSVLRQLIWLYFWLLIFEGALRKWIPSLSAPLLVVRDPIVLLIYLQALRCRRFRIDGHMVGYFVLVVSFTLLVLAQIIWGIGGGPVVAAYGMRTNFLHLPLIFVIPQAFSSEDVSKLGRWMLILCLPMTALMIVQYLSPPGSWVNAATSADAEQISFVMGKVRAAGTFSFASGAAHFFSLATAFAIYGIADRHSGYKQWLVWGALVCIVIVQPVSGSRTLLLGCAFMVGAAILFAMFTPAYAPRIAALVFICCIAVAALSFTAFYREATDMFMMRWNSASASAGTAEQSVVGRFFSGFTEPFGLIPQAGVLGRGIGLGTNGGAALVTGVPIFLLAEGEWARVVLESGTLLGLSYLAYRLWLTVHITLRAVAARQLLPWLLAWGVCLSLPAEQISQPTNLGFMVLVSGLCLASIQKSVSREAIASELPDVQFELNRAQMVVMDRYYEKKPS